MIRKFFYSVLVVVISGVLGVCAYGQEEMVSVDSSVFGEPQRPAARFAHDEHNEKAQIDDCARCHHAFDENGKKDEYSSSEDQSCADCHELEDRGTVPGLRKAFHLNCKGCHLSQGQGPVVCAQCHSQPKGALAPQAEK